ncbi:AcrR family transcriptional regulator [Mesorhizobium soli]|jgi:AcrR family transcriptional regulator|uniref:TetR/AcrR family transcriptional regulator n=1 Tax=Pseudaminobacter soli (ex Li et al. 2025) TaxID=1295366 RepID=UPI002473FC51|nr:TetR/AcrR family transcriptional regulator [Mesorhizobium soli]MDH6234226.1 AcrR family transcriptional regulator [Mesorhizobium soli]
MGRRQSIDRNKVLDAAEKVVSEQGVNGLTIDAVAKACGISKGGVQYAFGTKDDLIAAMIDRWEAEFDAEVAELGQGDTSIEGSVRAHTEATRDFDGTSVDRAAVMLAALVQDKNRLAKTRAWYEARMAQMDTSTEAGRRLRLAFLASEGAFLLRSFGFMPMTDEEWQQVFDDILGLVGKGSE